MFDAGDVLTQTPAVEITRETRFAELSEKLAIDGGSALFDVLKDSESLRHYKINKRSQHSMGEASKAPMIHKEFGNIEFSALSAADVEAKFNALYGSNTKPRGQFKPPTANAKDFANLSKLSD